MVLKWIIFSLAVAALDAKCISKENEKEFFIEATGEQDWWKNAVFYQIYPRSFKDSNNDGIGDLKGIISKLEHLKEAGITAAWLSPIFKSPQVDQGYDISDFRDIEPDYGTIEDFENLLAKAKELGIKIILDFVPNHTSDKHEWFQKSVAREAGYEDYYIWQDCEHDDATNKTTPPNNWETDFKGSAWEYNHQRKQCYYHAFVKEQPDLNYRSPKLVQEMKDILTFWLDKGVDGFRVDAVPFLFEVTDVSLNEPRSKVPGVDENESGYLYKYIYTRNQPETRDMVYQWRKLVDDYTKDHGGDTRLLMSEAYANWENTKLYYGTEDGKTRGAHFCFNFDFIANFTKLSTVEDLEKIIVKWLSDLPDIYTPNWVLGNHDNHRVASRYGAEHVDAFNMLLSMLPGVQVTYNGEEIGMEDGEVTCDQGKDPSAIKNCSTFDQTSRDFERTPFQWDNSTNSGFNDGAETWLPVSKKYLETNVQKQRDEGIDSHFGIYKALLQLRKKLVGDVELTLKTENTIFELSRHVTVDDGKKETYRFVYNRGTQDYADTSSDEKEYEVVLASVGSQNTIGQKLTRKSFILKPAESIILKVVE